MTAVGETSREDMAGGEEVEMNFMNLMNFNCSEEEFGNFSLGAGEGGLVMEGNLTCVSDVGNRTMEAYFLQGEKIYTIRQYN